jgi:hypothetical protein
MADGGSLGFALMASGGLVGCLARSLAGLLACLPSAPIRRRGGERLPSGWLLCMAPGTGAKLGGWPDAWLAGGLAVHRLSV